MARLRFSLVAAIAAVAACSVAAATPALATDVPVWQGTAFITAVSSACTTDGVAFIGDYYTMVYREQPRPSQTSYGGAIQFASGRDTLAYVMGPNLPLPGGGEDTESSVAASGQSSLVGPYNYTGGFDLNISATAGTPKNVTISGTVANLFNVTGGCTITIEASLALRP